jgi:uncharacterized protein (TIGR02646 family)
MRPVERGAAPKSYARYQDAIGDLEARLGIYCSYCERRLPVGLAVEHIRPKALNPELENEWGNFLLGCPNCNSVKGSREVEIDKFLWPDRNNTLLAFTYSSGGFVSLANSLNKKQKIKAQALLDLVGLQNHEEQGWKKPAPRDKRWQQREEVWTAAEYYRGVFEYLEQVDEAVNLILEAAKGYGFFSVWMAVFDNYPDIKKGLIHLFPGTAQSCFDQQSQPVNRPNSII